MVTGAAVVVVVAAAAAAVEEVVVEISFHCCCSCCCCCCPLPRKEWRYRRPDWRQGEGTTCWRRWSTGYQGFHPLCSDVNVTTVTLTSSAVTRRLLEWRRSDDRLCDVLCLSGRRAASEARYESSGKSLAQLDWIMDRLKLQFTMCPNWAIYHPLGNFLESMSTKII